MNCPVRVRRLERHEPPRSNEPILNSLISVAILAARQRRTGNCGHRKEQRNQGKQLFHVCAFI